MSAAKRQFAEFLQVLEYYDGPQAILLKKTEHVMVVAVAIEVPESSCRFFGACISLDQWERYRRGYIDFRSLFLYPRWREWYMFNFDLSRSKILLGKSIKHKNSYLPYMPDAGFFSYDHSEDIIVGRLQNVATQKYKTDGIWVLPDFTMFYNKLNDLYAFFLSLKTFSNEHTPVDKKKKIKDSFLGHPLRGGSSYNNLYSDLASVQTFDDRIAVGKLKYASPGEVDIKGRFDVFTEIAVAYNELSENHEILKLQYNELYKYLENNKLLRDRHRFDLDSPVAFYVLKLSNTFAASLHLSDSTLILELTERNPLIFAKILLSYFRRLERYFLFFAEGRVKEPELSQSIGTEE